MVATMNQNQTASKMEHEAENQAEGPVARAIEKRTAQIPSDWFLWAAGASIVGSLSLMGSGSKHTALFVGQWAPTFLLLGIYNKIVKVAGSDRAGKSSDMSGRHPGSKSGPPERMNTLHMRPM